MASACFLIVSFRLLFKSNPSLSFLTHPLLPLSLSAYFQEQLESCFWLCRPALRVSDSQQCSSGAALLSGGEAGWRSQGEGPLSQTSRPLTCWASGHSAHLEPFICPPYKPRTCLSERAHEFNLTSTWNGVCSVFFFQLSELKRIFN